MTLSVSPQSGNGIALVKHQGRISENSGSATRLKGKIGIGHTRWATHGIPNDVNAHPHTDCSDRSRWSIMGSSKIMQS